MSPAPDDSRPKLGARPRRRWPRWIGIAVAVLVALQVVVPLITLNGARSRIVAALEAGLGRQVEAGNVHLHLLPWPAIELDQVRLSDNPAFGAEAMVYADQATATFRFWPLIRGKLVIARISLEDASINLVRNRDGEWNVAALLQGVSSRSAGKGASLAAARPLAAQPFPYLEWSDSRVNFKFHQTKTRFYLAQVQGSLAHDAGGWRLQASFQPERTDLSLSNTGDVQVNGRWPAGGGSFRQRPFEMEFRLRNSYLAGSSALLAGHDAGVHGVLDAQVHVEGPGFGPGAEPEGFHLTGSFQAHSLRRWDLLPPPATVSGNFSGLYYPGQDRFELIGLGDPGWKHLQVEGEVDHVFTRPRLQLHLQMRQFRAANLLPLFLALKSGLPANLEAKGRVNGTAQVDMDGLRPPTQWNGQARMTLSGFVLQSGTRLLRLPKAELAWSSRSADKRIAGQLRIAPVAAELQTGSGPPALLRLGASAGHAGFTLRIASPAFTGADAGALTSLLGLHSPWMAGLGGAARLQLQLEGEWSDFGNLGWEGTAAIANPSVPELARRGLRLTGVEIRYADPKPVQIAFTARFDGASAAVLPGKNKRAPHAPAPEQIRGTVFWPRAGTGASDASGSPAPPVAFSLSASDVHGVQIWNLLRPSQLGLLRRLLGHTSLAPVWLRGLDAHGTVHIANLDWHGFHSDVTMGLRNTGSAWSASPLDLRLAGGAFNGRGSLSGGSYEVTGKVRRRAPLRLATLLASTPYRGLISGSLEGDLDLDRPLGGRNLAGVSANGRFALRDGHLATRQGSRPFALFAAEYRLRNGTVQLKKIVWIARGETWHGRGSVDLAPHGRGFELELTRPGSGHGSARRLRLSGPVTAAARPAKRR